MVCFDAKELEVIYEATMKELLNKEIFKAVLSGHSYDDIKQNKEMKSKIADSVITVGLKDKSNIEFFIALDTCFSVYQGNDRKICFVLKDSIPPETKPANLEKLKKIIKEDTLTDFAIWSEGNLRQFQLKQYKGELKTEAFFDFIKIKLKSYGNNLGNVNLLLILQGSGDNIFGVNEINFKELHRQIGELKLNFSGEILVTYNEQNKFNIINQVYPALKSMQKKFNFPSERWE